MVRDAGRLRHRHLRRGRDLGRGRDRLAVLPRQGSTTRSGAAASATTARSGRRRRAGGAVDTAERDAEIRQMLGARNARAAARGEAEVDVEDELQRLTAPAVDPGLREEVRELVVARNRRREARGEAPLDVEARGRAPAARVRCLTRRRPSIRPGVKAARAGADGRSMTFPRSRILLALLLTDPHGRARWRPRPPRPRRGPAPPPTAAKKHTARSSQGRSRSARRGPPRSRRGKRPSKKLAQLPGQAGRPDQGRQAPSQGRCARSSAVIQDFLPAAKPSAAAARALLRRPRRRPGRRAHGQPRRGPTTPRSPRSR